MTRKSRPESYQDRRRARDRERNKTPGARAKKLDRDRRRRDKNRRILAAVRLLRALILEPDK